MALVERGEGRFGRVELGVGSGLEKVGGGLEVVVGRGVSLEKTFLVWRGFDDGQQKAGRLVLV